MYAIAIDMGGTKIEGAILSSKGKILFSKRILTEANKGKKQVMKNLTGIILLLKKEAKNSKKKIKGIGISMPGFVNSKGKVVFGGGTLDILENINIKLIIEKKSGLKVFIDNDSNCFALAEAVYGAGKKHNIVLGVIWGSGVASGIIVNKKVFQGSFGGAGEWGHSIVMPDTKTEPTCGCGKRGCIEMLCSGKNVVRRYYEKGGKIKDANPRNIYDSKEKVAKQVINDMIHFLGLGLAFAVNTINPDIVVMGGGTSKLPSSVYKRLNQEMKKYAITSIAKDLKIVRHQVSDSAGILGAGVMVFES